MIRILQKPAHESVETFHDFEGIALHAIYLGTVARMPNCPADRDIVRALAELSETPMTAVDVVEYANHLRELAAEIERRAGLIGGENRG